MFKKFKDKLAEEMKQSPARLQASMQQLAQAVSPSLSNISIPEQLSASNDNFSLTDEINSITNMSNPVGLSRTSSINSIAADTSGFNLPMFPNFGSTYHLQSDFEQSASEIDENIPSQLDQISKDQIYSAYRKVQTKYHKYRGRYTDLAKHYKDMERIKNKLESLLVETQDKALRRISDLKEQCQMEQQAKAHLEEALRNDIEEKEHIINTLNTKVKLLKSNDNDTDNNVDNAINLNRHDETQKILDDEDADKNLNLISLDTESQLSNENHQLKNKLEKLEAIISKYKESLKRSKDKISELNDENYALERDINILKETFDEKVKLLNDDLDKVRAKNVNLNEQINIMKKREEESVISLAENKLFIHRELEIKEEQIKQLNLELKNAIQAKENAQQNNTLINDNQQQHYNVVKDTFQSVDLLTADYEPDIPDGDDNKTNNFESRCLELENQLKNCQETIKNNETIINELKNDKINIIDNIKNYNKSIGTFKFDYINIKEDFNKYTNYQKNELYNIRETIINNLNNYNVIHTKLNNDKINELYEKINLLENNLSDKNIIENQLKETNIELKKLKNINNKLIAENENINFKLFDYNKKYQDTINSMKDIKKEYEALKEKYLNQEETLNKQPNKNDDECVQCQKLSNELKENSIEFNDKISFLIKENDNYKNNIDEYKEKFSEVTGENNSLKTNVEMYIDKVKNLEEKQIEIEKSNNLLEQEKNQMNLDLNNQIQSLKNIIENLEKDNLNNIEEITKEKDSLNLSLSNLHSLNSKLIEDNKNLSSEMNKYKEVEDKMEQISVENKRLIEELENYRETTKNTFKNQNDENEKLSNKLEELEKEKQIIESDNKQLKDNNNELVKYNDELQESEELLREKVEQLEDLLKNTSEKILPLTDELVKLKQMMELQKTETEEKFKEKDNLIKELKEYQSSQTIVEDEFEKVKSNLNETNNLLENSKITINNLKEELQDKDSKISDIETKELQLRNLNEQLNTEINKLNDEIKNFESEQSIRINQVVKEFQAQLNDKNEELEAALGKKFDRQQTYESELIQQYKEQLKDFQIELTVKSEEIESLKNHVCTNNFTEEENKYLNTIKSIKIEHENEMKQLEDKWNENLKEKIEELQKKHDKIVNELTQQWKKNQSAEESFADPSGEFENVSRVAVGTVQSNSGSFQSLQRTLLSQRRELVELRKLINLRHETLEDSTEIEYLRNILYEYMMGRETLVLARVIAAVVKFNDEQTNKVIKKEEDKLTLLGSLGLS